MYSKAKYIIGEIRSNLTGFETLAAVVFPETVGHDDMAKVFIPNTIVAAGFCHEQDGMAVVYDKSVSLRKSSRPGVDEVFVGRAMALPEYVSGI